MGVRVPSTGEFGQDEMQVPFDERQAARDE
jgi:hypothetical protein